MIPRILLLFAFIIIDFKIVQVIYKKAFKEELCNDGFYDGGIRLNAKRRSCRPKNILNKDSIHCSYISYKKHAN